MGSSGKRLSDLHLRDEPEDIRSTAWFQFTEQIDVLLDSGDYEWASTTLLGIKETVGRTRAVTEGQQRAVANIETGARPNKHRGNRVGFNGSGSRRYEGFTKGRDE